MCVCVLIHWSDSLAVHVPPPFWHRSGALSHVRGAEAGGGAGSGEVDQAEEMLRTGDEPLAGRQN